MKPGDVLTDPEQLDSLPAGSVVSTGGFGVWTSYLSAVVPGLVVWRRPAQRGGLPARVLSSRDLMPGGCPAVTVVSLPAPELVGDGG